MSKETNLPRILIVDDEPAIQRFLATALAGGEFAVFQAENGQAALGAGGVGQAEGGAVGPGGSEGQAGRGAA